MNNQTIASPGNATQQTAYIQYRHELKGQCYIEENSIFYICRGRWRVEHGATILEACVGNIVFLRQHTLIRYQLLAHGSLEAPAFLLITLSSAVVRDFVKQAHLPITASTSYKDIVLHKPSQQLYACLQSVKGYFDHGASMTDWLTRLKIQELLYCLPGNATDRPFLDWILDLRQSYRCDITDVVEENLTNSISLAQLARMSGRSLSSFRRDFLAIYNMTPSKWIRQRRLEKSLEMLVSTRMSITDICYTLGFENIAHFSRLFKSRFGMPPSACRSTGNSQPATATTTSV